MNIQINVFVDFSGPFEELYPLVDKIEDAVVECGYGVDEVTDVLKSLITVTPSRLSEFSDASSFARSLVHESALIAIPQNKGGSNEHTRD